mmetsp:Transcript_44709/g.149260  ORF Transcript_44709/g.149260 Transcript_44709/m.149260 type:complete len:158 (-) Transcript_44709:82-555(-)
MGEISGRYGGGMAEIWRRYGNAPWCGVERRYGGDMAEIWGDFTCRTCWVSSVRAGRREERVGTPLWAVSRCGVKRTHAGASHLRPLRHAATGAVCGWAEEKKERWRRGATVKERSEPCHIQHVLQVVSGARGGGEEGEAEVAAAAFANSVRVFGLAS